jgi:coproporphyrinogen III oxidase-like Fe-S oxidoreductase
MLAAGRDPIGGDEELTEQNRLAESVYLGLRTDAGLPLEKGERDLVASWEVAQWVALHADDRRRCDHGHQGLLLTQYLEERVWLSGGTRLRVLKVNPP